MDSLDVEGALRSERLNEADLATGLYDNALIEICRVNWQAPEQRVLMRYGNLGEVSRGRHHFRAEIRGLAHELQQPKGRIVQFGCDADLGDARSRPISISRPTAAMTGWCKASPARRGLLSSQVSMATTITGSRAGSSPGSRAPMSAARRRSGCTSKTPSGVTIELWQRMTEAIAEGDNFRIVAGYDKQFSTCRAKFNNVANFRGFPHVPGNDFMLSVASRKDKNDGKSRFG